MTIKVSIAMITYNHEPYIAQAIEGALRQETDFDYEIIIGEDCSTDNTRRIVKDYADKYPDCIVPVLSEKNIGSRPNAHRTWKRARGEYLAKCEGDDYWTSPHKLQKQVDFLDAHPDYTVCFHPVKMVWDDDSHEPMVYYPEPRKETYTLEELLRYNFIATCSVMYRWKHPDELPSWYEKSPVGDWPLHLIHAMHGKIGYIDECMGVYRQHSGGKYAGTDREKRLKLAIRLNRIFQEGMEDRYQKYLKAGLSEKFYELSLFYYDNGDFDNAWTYAKQCLRLAPYNRHVPVYKLIQMLIKTSMPGPYRRIKAMSSKSGLL